jgi:hypothetical protein
MTANPLASDSNTVNPKPSQLEGTTVDLSPGVRQPVKTLLTVGWKILDRQDNCTAYWKPVGEAEAVPAGEQTAEE